MTVHQTASAVARAYECRIVEYHLSERDWLGVGLEARKWDGERVYGSVQIGAPAVLAAQRSPEQLEALITCEVTSVAQYVRAEARKRDHRAVTIAIGVSCPHCAGHRIRRVNYSAWTMDCGNATHELPQRVTCGLDAKGDDRIRTREGPK